MKDDINGNEELPREPDGTPEAVAKPTPIETHPLRAQPASPAPAAPFELPQARTPAAPTLDKWTFLDALWRNWAWLPVGGILLAAAGFYAGRTFWKFNYTATAKLIHANPPHVIEVLGDRDSAAETFASLLRAPELLQHVATHADPPVSATFLAKKLTIVPEHNSDVVDINVSAQDAATAIRLANFYAEEAVRYTQQRQSNNAAEINEYVTRQLTPIENELGSVKQQMTNRPVPKIVVSEPAGPPPVLIDKLQAARVELGEMKSRYTDEYPQVREQKAKIAALEAQLAALASAAPTNPAVQRAEAEGAAASTRESDTEFLHAKAMTLENNRIALMSRKLAALTVQVHAPGSCQVMSKATLQDVMGHGRTKKSVLLAVFGGVFGILGMAGLILLVEALDPRLKTAADVSRVTNLPVLATAANFERMSEGERRDWAFRAWTRLSGRLSPSPNHGFVCGFTSCEPGEGRSTWMRLLADAASQRGFRVLTIVARPDAPPEKTSNGKPHMPSPAATFPAPANGHANGHSNGSSNGNGNGHGSELFITPDEVTEKLIGPNREPVVQIPLPGWVWDLERRKQWQSALQLWSKIDNIALLAELPPASMPESVLLAENLPNLIWLADSRKATASKTREQMDILRHARCNLVGAVLNNAPVSFLKARLSRWVA